MAFIRGLAKCKWSKRKLAVRAAVSVAPPLSGGGLIRLRAYRRKRALAQPIGIALAFLGQCDNSLGDDLFSDIWLTAAAKRLARFFERGTHRPSVIGSKYRVSNKGKGSSHRAPFAFQAGALLVSQPPTPGLKSRCR
jgi:hypothetical protein